jgi:glycosyltransferase involved in cell wall biosynthesis
MSNREPRPVISVVLEGYNQEKNQGTANNTIYALRQQDFPLEQVQVILAGSSPQVEEWLALCANPAPFHSIKAVAVDGGSYYALKNRGAEEADGEIIAFTDSDVYPVRTWITAIVSAIRQGADVSVGLSLFKDAHGWQARSLPRAMAVSCTFGYILGPRGAHGATLRGFMDHNVGARADIVRKARYRTEFGRVIASPLLFRELERGGCEMRFSRNQSIAHYFGWFYWVRSLHFRYGFEVHRLRRLDPGYPNQWIRKAGPLEPVATLFWHMMLDIPRWLRFGRARGMSVPMTAICLPALVMISGIARTAEMFGMYATMLAPRSMARWVATV